MRNLVTLLALALLLAASPALAKHGGGRFLGPHPIAAAYGGGYCYIEVPHIHAYVPDHPGLYHPTPDGSVFVGDPTPFGYDGPKYTFYGHHPVVGAPPGVYCYLDGPHYHDYPPPAQPDYRVDKGVAFYVGGYDPVYYKEKPHRVKMIQAEYRPYVGLRPTVEVQPPPEWHGDVWVAPPSVEVSAPGVYVGAPAPVVVGAPPPVVVGAPPPHVIVGAPPPHVIVGAPPPHVIVGAPPPHVVVGAPGVYVAPPAPHVIVAPAPVVVGAPGVIVEERYRHDNGRHEGWYKHHGDDDDHQGNEHGEGHGRGHH
jgi:hypothetical protein